MATGSFPSSLCSVRWSCEIVFPNWSATVLTNLMPQHAFQPVLSGRGNIDGEFGFAVDHGQRGSGQEIISQPHQDLTKHKQISPPAVFSRITSLLAGMCFMLANKVQNSLTT